jgi:hypothetical protein
MLGRQVTPLGAMGEMCTLAQDGRWIGGTPGMLEAGLVANRTGYVEVPA